MPGDIVGPNYRPVVMGDSLSSSGRRDLRRAKELYRVGEVEAVLDTASTKRFIDDAVDIVSHARRKAGGDQALLGILAPIVENWLNREHANIEDRNMRRRAW